VNVTLGSDSLVVIYRNYRDEVRERRIRPVRWWFGKTKYHPEPCWFCTAVDLERKGPDEAEHVVRDFAVTGFLAIGQDAVDNYRATQEALKTVVQGG
jgi:hypothetical protein